MKVVSLATEASALKHRDSSSTIIQDLATVKNLLGVKKRVERRMLCAINMLNTEEVIGKGNE